MLFNGQLNTGSCCQSFSKVVKRGRCVQRVTGASGCSASSSRICEGLNADALGHGVYYRGERGPTLRRWHLGLRECGKRDAVGVSGSAPMNVGRASPCFWRISGRNQPEGAGPASVIPRVRCRARAGRSQAWRSVARRRRSGTIEVSPIRLPVDGHAEDECNRPRDARSAQRPSSTLIVESRVAR